MSEDNSLGLAELIEKVKEDLLDEGSQPPIFSIDQVVLELQVKVQKKAEGGIDIKVVQLGGTLDHEDVQNIKVTLSPLLSKEEIVSLYKKNPRKWQEVEDAILQSALKK